MTPTDRATRAAQELLSKFHIYTREILQVEPRNYEEIASILRPFMESEEATIDLKNHVEALLVKKAMALEEESKRKDEEIAALKEALERRPEEEVKNFFNKMDADIAKLKERFPSPGQA